jgi:hypothetical protein
MMWVGDGALAGRSNSVLSWSLVSVVVRVATSTARTITRPIAISRARCLPRAVRGSVPGAGAREVKVVVTVFTSRGRVGTSTIDCVRCAPVVRWYLGAGTRPWPAGSELARWLVVAALVRGSATGLQQAGAMVR